MAKLILIVTDAEKFCKYLSKQGRDNSARCLAGGTQKVWTNTAANTK